MKFSVFTTAAVVFATTVRASPLVVREVASGDNVADKAVLPIYYVIIANAKESDAHQVLTARQLDVSEDDKEHQNSIILFISGEQSEKRDVNAYSDYIKAANPKEILGE